MKRIRQFIGDVRGELEKVKWPSRDEAVRLTMVVVVVSIILGVYIGTIDFALTKAIETFIQ